MPAQRDAHVDCAWGVYDTIATAAAPPPRITKREIVGLTLLGGSGWLERSFGLACDNLRSVDVVTADATSLAQTRYANDEIEAILQRLIDKTAFIAISKSGSTAEPRLRATSAMSV